ncbi:hypothetical protein RMN56_24185 [Micromonospora halotolerans]|uniref:Uncharacterized protein n=1 Tax=Micromonospora halotolerans TaxID=709879 RepID=A0ABY9ZSE7_9ACTN|nr:hypothetical protein [Micromonospora halotolerans]WNM38218.1 hypothetical protein RMN56_24185 [Micromonospora halotolerans]
MHGLSAIDDDRRFRPARTDAPLTARPAAPPAAVPRAGLARAVRR